jgi:hypothetical protein
MRALTAAAAILVAMLVPSAAFASGGGQGTGSQGVHVDPGSPSGHQYVIPITGARGEASPGGGALPGGGSSTGGGTTPPLFGVGITPTGGSGASTHSSRGRSSHAATRRGGGARRPASGASAPAPPSFNPARVGVGSTGGNAWLILLAGGALVLLAGAGGGFAVRRMIPRA